MECFPQCNLHGGPHFPSKRHKKFKEFMRTLSLGGKWASWSAMLAQSLADAGRHGVACFPVALLVQSCSVRLLCHCSWGQGGPPDTAAAPPICPDTPVPLGKEPSSHCKQAGHLGPPAGNP